MLLRRGLRPAAQRFGDAPGLRDAATWRKGLVRVEDLANRTDTRLVERVKQSLQISTCLSALLRVHFEPCVYVRSVKPGPHRSLVIRRIAGAQVSVVLRLVIGVSRRERSQTDGCQQAPANDVEDRTPPGLIEHGVWERNGEDLVRPACG